MLASKGIMDYRPLKLPRCAERFDFEEPYTKKPSFKRSPHIQNSSADLKEIEPELMG
jgi:hypothetical protein